VKALITDYQLLCTNQLS